MLCFAVRQLTDRNGGSIFSPDDPCTKTGQPVLQILQEKHPMPWEPTNLGTHGGDFEPYSNLPSCMGPQVSSDIVEVVCSKMSRAAGPNGVNSSDLCAWLLQFGLLLLTLCHEIGELTNWLASCVPSWESYCTFMA